MAKVSDGRNRERRNPSVSWSASQRSGHTHDGPSCRSLNPRLAAWDPSVPTGAVRTIGDDMIEAVVVETLEGAPPDATR
jgi:hypothetical protein